VTSENYIKITERLIGEIKDIANSARVKLKPKILELAKHINDGISSKRPEIMNKAKIVLGDGKEVDSRCISKIIKRIREEHFPAVSDRWIETVLPEKYKEHREGFEKQEKLILSEQISDNNLYMIKDEIIERIRGFNKTASKDIKIKDTVEDLERYTWSCYMAQELARLAIKMERDHEQAHDPSLCSKTSKHVKTARDGRFATPLSHYEAIIVAANSTQSLNHVCEGEWEFLQRWEVQDNEKKCRECLNITDCERRKCKHVCHDIIKPMTTKGLKYAIKTDAYLRDLDLKMKQLMEDDNDICPLAKIILENKLTDKYLDGNDKKRVMSAHIVKENCIQCQRFLREHGDFFDSRKT